MPITTALEPWHLSYTSEGKSAFLSDANGKKIALFPDAKDAEYALSLFDKIKELELEIEELEEHEQNPNQ